MQSACNGGTARKLCSVLSKRFRCPTALCDTSVCICALYRNLRRTGTGRLYTARPEQIVCSNFHFYCILALGACGVMLRAAFAARSMSNQRPSKHFVIRTYKPDVTTESEFPLHKRCVFGCEGIFSFVKERGCYKPSDFRLVSICALYRKFRQTASRRPYTARFNLI